MPFSAPVSEMAPSPWTTNGLASWTFTDRQTSPGFGSGQYVPYAINTTAGPLNRPRSSPSTFRPSPESLPWTESGLETRYEPIRSQNVTDPIYASGASPPPPMRQEEHASPDPSDLQRPQARRVYSAMAPNPAGALQKRQLDEDEDLAGASAKRRRTSSIGNYNLNEDDRFLVTLKEEENLPWKEIAARFGSDRGRNVQVAALQMRYKRLRERYRVWESQDVDALKQAYEYYEKNKWDIISSKVSRSCFGSLAELSKSNIF